MIRAHPVRRGFLRSRRFTVRTERTRTTYVRVVFVVSKKIAIDLLDIGVWLAVPEERIEGRGGVVVSFEL